MNQIEIIKNYISKGVNPQEIAIQLAGNSQNPMLVNLINMAKQGDYNGVETFAKNIFKEQGRDFDAEMKNMQEMIQSFK